MTRGLRDIIVRRVWEPLSLARAELRARSYTPEQRERARSFARAAATRLRVGQEHRDEEGLIAALSLYREAARLALAGQSAAAGRGAADGTLAPEEALAALEAPGLGASEQDLDALKTLLFAKDPLALDRMPQAERRELALAAERAIRGILDSYEIRTLPELRAQRVIRASAALAGAAGLIFAVLTALSSAAAPDEGAANPEARGASSKATRSRKH
jgi:hypothetical protein